MKVTHIQRQRVCECEAWPFCEHAPNAAPAPTDTRVPLGSNIITLFQGPDAWMAHFSGPYADFVRRAFGSDILPTAFTIQAAEADVYAAMVRMNPGFIVMLEAQC